MLDPPGSFSAGRRNGRVPVRSRWLGMAVATAALLCGEPASGAIVNFVTIADGVITDLNGDGTFTSTSSSTTGNTLSVRNFAGTGPDSVEDRSIAEFNLSSLSADPIQSVSFLFEVASDVNDGTRVDVYGYVGDGFVRPGDATVSAVLLGTWDPVVFGLGLQSVALDAAAFADLVAQGPIVGLRFQGTSGTNTQFDSLEGAMAFGTIAPTLAISAVPEPGSVALLSLASLVAAGGWYRKRRKEKAPAGPASTG